MQLGFYLCKGNLEVEVICARDICPEEKEEPGNLEAYRFPSLPLISLARTALASVYSSRKILATWYSVLIPALIPTDVPACGITL